MSYGKIYLITNLVNNKKYVGQTTRNSIKKRFNEHVNNSRLENPPLIISKAIKKHGKENFKIEQVDYAKNQEELNKLEGFYIQKYNCLAPNGYNLTNIIDGKGKHHPETIDKMRILAQQPDKLKLLSNNGKKRRGKSSENSSSKYCGVYLLENKYASGIRINKKNIYIGCYRTEENAAKAYDIAAIQYFGKDANLNFPELRDKYLNNEIIVNKNTKHDKSKSGIKGIRWEKSRNRWQIKWFDKNLNKIKSKNFKTIEEAKKYQEELLCL